MKHKHLTHNQAAFSMVEVIVVIAIIGVLAAVAVTSYDGITEASRKAVAMNRQKQLNNAVKEFGHAQWPLSTGAETTDGRDEIHVLQTLQWRDDTVEVGVAGPFFRTDWIPTVSNDVDEYRLIWAGTYFRLAGIDEAGTGILVDYDSKDFGTETTHTTKPNWAPISPDGKNAGAMSIVGNVPVQTAPIPVSLGGSGSGSGGSGSGSGTSGGGSGSGGSGSVDYNRAPPVGAVLTQQTNGAVDIRSVDTDTSKMSGNWTQSNGTKIFATGDENIDGWTSTASDSQVEVWESNPSGFQSQDGGAFFELNGHERGTLFQEVNVRDVARIRISFSHAKRRYENEVVNVWAGGTAPEKKASAGAAEDMAAQGFRHLLATDTTGIQEWKNYTIDYDVPLGMVKLYVGFESTGGSNGIGNFLDNVDITVYQTRSNRPAPTTPVLEHNVSGTLPTGNLSLDRVAGKIALGSHNNVGGWGTEEVLFEFAITEGGTYWVAAQVKAPTGNDDSFHVAVNGEDRRIWHTGRRGEEWFTSYYRRDYQLDPGYHTVAISQRENGTWLTDLKLVKRP